MGKTMILLKGQLCLIKTNWNLPLTTTSFTSPSWPALASDRDTGVDGLMLINAAGAILDSNVMLEKLLGVAAQTLSGRNFADFLDPPLRDSASAQWHRFLHNNRNVCPGHSREWAAVRADGQLFPIDLTVLAYECAGDHRWVIRVRDLTQYRREHTSLGDSPEIRRAILCSANVAIVCTWVDGVIRVFNPGAERLLGYRAEDLIGKQMPTAFHDANEVAAHAAYLSNQLGTEIPIGFEVFVARARRGLVDENIWTYTRQDGTRIKALLSVSAVRDDDNVLTGFMGVAVDLSEQTRVSQLLRERELQLQAASERISRLMEALPDVLVQLDTTGQIALVSGGLQQRMLFGLLAVEQTSFLDWLPELQRPAFLQRKRACLATSEMSLMECVTTDSEGNTLDLELRLSPLTGGAILLLIRDIGDRKETERLKNEFVATVSHELRTPLTSIRGALGLLASGVAGTFPGQAQQLIRIAEANSKRLTMLMNDILDMEKIESGTLRFEMAPQVLQELLGQAIEGIGHYAGEFNITIINDSLLNRERVLVDAGRLLQVLNNILSNAVKFSQRNSEVRISTMIRPDLQQIRLSVRDYGVGIPQEFRARIFGKFSQADGSDARYRMGTGLGLSISKALLEHMQGKIGFESEEGEGSTFFIDLPLYEPTALIAPEITEERFLLLSEDPGCIVRLTSLLRREQALLDVESTQASAERALLRFPYRAVLLDVSEVSPETDRFMLLLGRQRIPVIMLAKPQSREEGDWCQIVVGWLNRPPSEQALHELLSTIVPQASAGCSLLHVEQDENVVEQVRVMRQDAGRVDQADTLALAKKMLLANHYDLILLDLNMPDGDGTSIIDFIQERGLLIPVVIFSVRSPSVLHMQQVAAALGKFRINSDTLLDTVKRFMRGNTHDST